MVKALCLPILLLLPFAFFQKIIFANASIAINEIFPNPAGDENTDEWVELYNNGQEDVDVVGWTICDASRHALIISNENTTGATTIIKSKDYLVVNRNGSSFSLNNSGDETVALFNSSSCGSGQVDTISYNGTSEEKSWGRIPNGTGNLEKNLEKTPGSVNIPPQPSPEPQSSPKDETSSTSNTKKEKQVSPKPVAITTTQKSPSPKPKSAKVLGSKNQSSATSLLSSSPTPSPEELTSGDETSSSNVKVAGILTGFGALLIGASCVFYFWYYKVKGKPKLEIKKPETDGNHQGG